MASSKPMNFEKLKEMVTCQICLEIMEGPQTFPCFHTFCKSCIGKMHRPERQANGYNCPMCRGFSQDSEIRPNFMVEQLLELYIESKKERKCAQCSLKDPPERCNDCKMDLCTPCGKNHCNVPFLKGHKVAPIDPASREKIHVDTLIFCREHKDKLVEFNCRNEERTLCVNCKILEHNSHNTETIPQCLERITPWTKEKAKILTDDIDKHREIIEQIDTTKGELDGNLKEVEQKLEAKKKAMINRIEADFKKLADDVKKQHKEETDRLDVLRSEMTVKVDERRQIATWVDISLKTAESASLMYTLQNDVRDRLVRATEGPEGRKPLPVIDRLQFTFNDKKMTDNGDNYLGNITNKHVTRTGKQ